MSALHKLYLKKFRYKIAGYKPEKYTDPAQTIDVISAWKGLELIIPDIMQRFNIGNGTCIEFGVEFGYSAVVFSNYFREIIGIDTFEGDIHTDHTGNHFEKTKALLAGFENIRLVKSTYQDWIKEDNRLYDLAHVDIVHTFEDTYACGLWAAEHAKCAIFHDTESFMDVRKAVIDIARHTGKQLYNYPFHNGLGIIVEQ
jgi:hypothetical protein